MHFIYLLTASIYWVLKVHWFHCKISVYICSVFFEFILKSFDHQTIKNWIFDFCRRLIIWCQSFLIGPRIRNMSSHVIWSVCLIDLLTILKKSQIKSNQMQYLYFFFFIDSASHSPSHICTFITLHPLLFCLFQLIGVFPPQPFIVQGPYNLESV